MGQLSKSMIEALDTVRDMSTDQQDLLALELLAHARALAHPPTRLSAAERAELEAELQAVRRGELASDADVAAMYGKYGL